MPSAFICGLSGLELAPSERDFLRDARPCGIILFARNCAEPDQVRRLVADTREALGGDALVLIDQEGGRVRRLRPPHWRELPAAASYAALYGRDPAAAVRAAHLAARLTAADLRDLGINTNCAPVLDLPQPGSHAIIGDRAYGSDVERIIALGRAVADGLSAGGVLPVFKHIPGHGRATKDSHHDLPVVDADRAVLDATDFAPFRALADLPAAMTAHVVYTAVDPSAPASASATVIGDVVRGAIGFQGLLMCDDLSMQALAGTMAERTRAVFAAGCDVALHCNGLADEMAVVAAGSPELSGAAATRFEAACAVLAQQDPFNVSEAETCLAEVLSLSA